MASMADTNMTEPIKAESPPNLPSDVKAAELPITNETRVLTPPTSEDMDKHGDNSSDLSDLESEDEDDIGEIEPDHYYGEGKIPVFKPTLEQFKSFSKFIDKIDKYGMKSGIVKVVPPPEWHAGLADLSDAVKTIKVKNPIMQEFAGTHGTYTQANIEKQRSYNLPQWKALTEESSHQPPAKRGERRRNIDAPAKARAAKAAAQGTASPQEPGARRRGRPPRNAVVTTPAKPEATPDVEDNDSVAQAPLTPTSPEHEDSPAPSKKRGRQAKAKPGPKPKPKDKDKDAGKAKSVSSRRMNNRSEANEYVDEAAFKGFNYKLENVEDYTSERCHELEEVYWKTVNYGTPMYGADMPGSLFEDKMNTWNVAHLENLLDVLGTKVPGVNTTYLYLGMWKATFAWHLEDVDLYSINYIHFGAPKFWYSISQEDARKFENAMKTLWPSDAKHCDQFLRHKTYLISPEKLKSQFNIKVNKLVHYEGEFVITYPYGYHSGFNLGYNCAESVNFATEPWLNYGRIAKKCYCEADSVWVDVNEIERKLRGEPTPEFYETEEEISDDEAEAPAPAPIAKARGRPKGTPGRKRKRDEKEEETGAKRKVKKIKIRVRVATVEPCVLCPNDVTFDELLPTDTGKQAHRMCALYTPETFIKPDKQGREKVFGIANVNKQRLTSKCNFCRQKRISFQCNSKKCTRGYHATCAAAAGCLVDYGPVPYFKEGVEYISEGYDFRCRFHRHKRAKGCDMKALESLSLNKSVGKGLKKGELVQAMFLGGETFAGIVVCNRPAEGAILVDVVPDGDRIEVEYKYLLPYDPDQSLRPKPSADALPLPEEFNLEGEEQITQQDGIPQVDDIFADDPKFKWAEWHSCAFAEVRNPAQIKVDLGKDEQIWHYIGKQSTEARPQYTQDPSKSIHNTKSNFLETVKPPPMPPASTVRRPTYQVNGTQYNSFSTPVWRPNQGYSPPAVKTPIAQIRYEKPYEYKPKIPVKPTIAAAPPIPPNPYERYPGPPSSQHWMPSAMKWNIQTQNAASNSSASAQSYANAMAQTSPGHAQAYPRLTSQTTANSLHVQPIQTSHGSYTAKNDQNIKREYVSQQPGHPVAQDNSPSSRNYYRDTESKYATVKVTQTPFDRAPHGQQKPNPAGANVKPHATAPAFPNAVNRITTSKPPTAGVDYLTSIQKYPYLKNALLRRPPKYTSPYAQGGGFTPEWTKHLEETAAPATNYTAPAGYRPPIISQYTPASAVDTAAASPYNHSLIFQSPSVSQASTPPQFPQYQSSTEFQQQVRREAPKAEESKTMNQWDQLLQQLSKPPAAKQQTGLPPTPPMHGYDSHSRQTSPYSQSQIQPAAHANLRSESVIADKAISARVGPPLPNSLYNTAAIDRHMTESPPRPAYSPISDVGLPHIDVENPSPGSKHGSGPPSEDARALAHPGQNQPVAANMPYYTPAISASSGDTPRS